MKTWIDAHIDEQLKLLKDLASIPAPSHREEKRVKFITEWLSNIGVKSIVDEAQNVIVPFNIENRNDITVFAAHTDVVFPDYDTNLPVKQDGDILYGPGVGDDTANVVALLMMIKYIKENNLKNANPVMVVLNSCEEGLGNLKGTKQLFKDYSGRIKEYVSFDGYYNGGIVDTAVGSERYKVTCKTIGGHSYLNFGNPNAIAYMSKLINKLDEQEVPKINDVKTTYNFGVINGGTSVNTIAQDVSMLYEYRSASQKAIEIMSNNFEKAINETKCKEASFEIEVVGKRPGNGAIDCAKEDALVNKCFEAIAKVTGDKVLKRRASSTDSNIPLSLGIPAVTFGLVLGDGEHTREEWIKVSSLAVGLEIGLNLFLTYFY